jgi:hypothetical protein
MHQLLQEGHRELQTPPHQHLLQRCRNIWQDNSLEYRRTKQNIQAAIARQELLAGAADRRAEGDSSALRPRTEQLLREGRSLHNSINRTDEIIA